MATVAFDVRRWWRRRRPEEKFPLRFLALMVVAPALLVLISPLSSEVVHLTVAPVLWIASLLDLHPSDAAGGVLHFGTGPDEFTYIVTPQCTSVTASFLFAGAVVAYPAKWSERWWGIAFGTVLLFALNTVRLVVLALLGLHAEPYFETAHVYWFQGMMIVGTGAIWLAWTRYVVQRDATANFAVPGGRELARMLALVVAMFSAVIGIGTLARLDDAYVAAIEFVNSIAGLAVWPGRNGWTELPVESNLYYWASVASLITLVMATPGVKIRDRARRAAFSVFALALVHQVGMIAHQLLSEVVITILGSPYAPFMILTRFLTFWVAPLALWYSWVKSLKRRRARGHKARPDSLKEIR